MMSRAVACLMSILIATSVSAQDLQSSVRRAANQTVPTPHSCFSDRTILLGIGATLAKTGGALLAIGIAKSHSSPSITVGPGRIAVHHRAPLHLGVRRLFIRR